VVDDDPGTLDTLSDVLTATGYETSMASSGHDAIAKVKATRFDLIVMDGQMPGLNGVQILHALRALDPHVSVIMMTAYTQDELVAESQRTTGFEVFSKPLELDRLLPLIKGILTSQPSGPSTAT
jgi:DNA-binding NtrC family response regulator